jgi:hypothetical protein
VILPRELRNAIQVVHEIDRARRSRPNHDITPEEVDLLLRAHNQLARLLAAEGKAVLQ